MAYKVSFLDGQTYGNDDLNAIGSLFSNGGVADPFTGGLPHNLVELNDIIYSVSTDGVVPTTDTSCKVIDATGDNVTIMSGTVIFDNGSKIVFDTEGATLPFVVGSINYVYVKSDLSANRIYADCSTTEPATGDYVLLAEISAAGVITDKRHYAQGKLPSYASNANGVMLVDTTVTLARVGTSRNYTGTYVIHMGVNNYIRLLHVHQNSSIVTMGYYDIPDNTYFSFLTGYAYPSVNDKIFINCTETYADGLFVCSVSGTDMTLTISGHSDASSPPSTITAILKIMIF